MKRFVKPGFWTAIKTFLLGGVYCATFAVVPVYAATQDSQVSQAVLFFQQVVHQTQNPVIAGLAQKSLLQLQYPRVEMHSEAVPILAMSAPLPPRYVQQGVSPRRTEVPLIPQPDHTLAVSVKINQLAATPFLVDTGATYTVITPALARQLNITPSPLTPRIMVMTANGTISAPLVSLNNVSVGGFNLNGVQAVVADLGRNSSFQGLLGMNVFKNMALTIESDRIVLSI